MEHKLYAPRSKKQIDRDNTEDGSPETYYRRVFAIYFIGKIHQVITFCLKAFVITKIPLDKEVYQLIIEMYGKDLLKGYLHYTKITSQNVSFEVQIKNFLFRRKITFRSQDIQVFVFLDIP